MQVEVPWGRGTVPVEVDSRRIAGVLSANVSAAAPLPLDCLTAASPKAASPGAASPEAVSPRPVSDEAAVPEVISPKVDPGGAADPDRLVRAELMRPAVGLDEFLAHAPSPLLVVVNDGTRPTPCADVLRVAGPALEEWLDVPGRHLTFVIATGTHRAASPEEVASIFGPALAQAHKDHIVSHDALAKDRLELLGRTGRGTDVWVNSLLAEARSVLLINSVEPHYFAGYTGGRKSLVPGLAGHETIRANHELALEAGSDLLALAGNPLHEDLEEATALATQGKEVFSVQLVLDRDHRIGFVAAGTLEDSFRRAVAVAETRFVLDIERPYEVVVAVAPYPMDCNFYQTIKAVQSGARAVKDGSVLIVVSECPFGLGENQILFDMLAAASSPAEAYAHVRAIEYRLGLHQAANVAALLRRFEIWTVTSLPEEEIRAMFMTPFAGVQEAVDAALARGGEDAQVLFLMEASITVPRVVFS